MRGRQIERLLLKKKKRKKKKKKEFLGQIINTKNYIILQIEMNYV